MPIFKDYMDTSCGDWKEENEFTAEHVRAIAMKKYNNLFTSGRCSTKDNKYAQILDIYFNASEACRRIKESIR